MVVWLLATVVAVGVVGVAPEEGEVVVVGGDGEVLVGVEPVAPVMVVDVAGVLL